MDMAAMTEMLTRLAQLDHYIMLAYDEALKKVGRHDPEIRYNFELFRNDHKLHTELILQAIADLRGEPPSLSAEVRGALLEEMDDPDSFVGTGGVLEAMRRNEELGSTAYAEAVAAPEFAQYPKAV
jgi:hypothetical protein